MNIALEVLNYQETLAINWGYKKLPSRKSREVRKYFEDTLPKLDKELPIYSKSGTLLAKCFKRIVIGDYGAFLEIEKEDMVKVGLKVKRGEEYRIHDKEFKDKVKYIWLTSKDNDDVKVYYQKRGVSYADYQPELFYISPHEIIQVLGG